MVVTKGDWNKKPKSWANVGLMLNQRRRRWSSIKPTLAHHAVFTGKCLPWIQWAWVLSWGVRGQGEERMTRKMCSNSWRLPSEAESFHAGDPGVKDPKMKRCLTWMGWRGMLGECRASVVYVGPVLRRHLFLQAHHEKDECIDQNKATSTTAVC